MAFCSIFGKVIADCMVCDCQMQAQNNPPVQNGGNKKQLIVIGISAVAVIVVLCLIISSIGGGYKDPINDLVKGFNKNDMETMLEATMPKDAIKELKDDIEDEDEDWKDVIDEANDYIEEAKEDLEDDYGKNVKLSVKFLDKKDVKKSDMKKLKERYDDYYDAEIKKAYKVKIEMTLKGKDDKDTEKGWLYVVNVKGDGWKVSTYGDESGLTDFADFF